MFKNTIAVWLVSASALPGFALAQASKPVAQKAEPTRIAVPAYESVFTNYKSYTEEKSPGWKALNSLVDRRGGWRQYAKEAQEPESPAEPPAATPATPSAPSGGASAPKTQP